MNQNVQYGVEVMSNGFNDSLTPKRRESPSRSLPRLSTMLGLLSRENGYQHGKTIASSLCPEPSHITLFLGYREGSMSYIN